MFVTCKNNICTIFILYTTFAPCFLFLGMSAFFFCPSVSSRHSVYLQETSVYSASEKSTFWVPREIISFTPYSLLFIYNLLLSDKICTYFVSPCNIHSFIWIHLLNAYYVSNTVLCIGNIAEHKKVKKIFFFGACISMTQANNTHDK